MVGPTIIPAAHFDPSEDANALRKAMKGLGTNEAAIINILSDRSSEQRQEILHSYNKERDLIKDLKKELSGHFEDLVIALMTPMEKYLAMELHRAMEGAGTNESVLIEILCTRNNHSIKALKREYEELYGKSLSKAIKKETSDDFEKLLVDLCECDRDEGPEKEDIAAELAAKLYKAGEGRTGADEDEIRRILCNESFATLRLVFKVYREAAGVTFGEVIEKELEGNFRKGMLAVYKSIDNKESFFAEALHASMAGRGTHDRTLIRLIVSRSEIDLETIKKEYNIIYNKPLAKHIKGDTSGYYEKLLLAILKE